VDNGEYCTWHEYDMANRLIASHQGSSCGSFQKQSKTWSYNTLGFLNESETPEGGRVIYRDFDVFGNPKIVENPVNDLSYTFDKLGRLTSVSQGTNSNAQRLIENTYIDGNLVEQHRHNILNGIDYLVTQEFEYAGKAGSLSRQITHVEYPDESGVKQMRSFEQSYDQTDLGSIERFIYPNCIDNNCGPEKNVEYDYTNNIVDKVIWNDSALNASAEIASIDYHELGTLTKITFIDLNETVSEYKQKSNGIQLEEIEVSNIGDTYWSSGEYQYNELGQITDIGGDSYAYDSAMRLTRAETQSIIRTYGYDEYDNMTQKQGFTIPVNLSLIHI